MTSVSFVGVTSEGVEVVFTSLQGWLQATVGEHCEDALDMTAIDQTNFIMLKTALLHVSK